MSIKTLFTISILAFIICLMGSCAKVATGPTFTWSYATYNTADSAFSPATNPAADEILAYTSMQIVRIQLSNTMTVGNHNLSSTGSGSFLYLYYSGVNLYSQSGTLNIAANNGTSMSGSFSATLSDGTGISGSFSDIPIR